jgi:1,4-dihydroxy-2-naphthoyl-CoA hydrolase
MEPTGDAAAMLNETLQGWVRAMGLSFVHATDEEVVAEWDVAPHHLQAYGIVHGGVHAGMIETVASVGAALHAMPAGRGVVGLENNTTFLRAVRGGRLRVTARPLHRGRTTHVWEATVTDEKGGAVASGRVRLLCLEQGADVGKR